ncbi:MAG: T9SS type A sorting domain-containing protein [Ignavibacteriales bacterium]|nr:MAG: T9SS type A sorting domain-containing protein [Ignavibacteriales bacterium]
MQLGDSMYIYPENENSLLVCFEINSDEFLGEQRPYKVFGNYFGLGYTIVKGLGIFIDYLCDFFGHESTVKGCVINGTVYGDTTFVVGIDDDPDQIPTEFKLEQNYPNPFNPSTKISWQSPVGSHQTLKVYDVLGREVATLVNEYKDAGSYEVEFDGTHLASGVYYYRIAIHSDQLKAGELIQTKKMILIK